ncbi:RagB/SusD family nutrient uptake outer membrane protein [Echinicola sediminis]
MKKTIYILMMCGALMACNDDGFLEETPRDRLTTSNAFTNYSQFKAGTNEFYRVFRQFYNSGDGYTDYVIKGVGTDIMINNVNLASDDIIYNDWNQVNPQTGEVNTFFNRCYSIIKDANNLLFESNNNPEAFTSEEQRLEIQAEVRFFRGFAYRMLGHLYGGVPINREPITSPKLDFERASRQEVYEFVVEDLEFAAQHLPLSTNEPGRIVRAAADHFLAEMYIALADESGNSSLYTKASEAASRVIDGTDGPYALMQNRFGTRGSEPNKDVFWDLFRMGNQDFQQGNTESIWSVQFEKDLPGGTNIFGRPLIERSMWPSYWAANKFGYAGPARDWTGRGVAFIRPTDFWLYTLWKDSGNDIRNNETNIQRKYYAPKVIENGVQTDKDTTYTTQVTLANGEEITVSLKPGDEIKKEWLTTQSDTMQRFYPKIWKFGTDKHLDGIPDGGYVRDFYAARLAETYLIRAEAYHKAGNNDLAAADINAVRGRASAPLISSNEVNIDYILDERARELFGEEFRLVTLCRLGKNHERTAKYGRASSSKTIRPENNLLPIPQSFIDANLERPIEQNKGY